MMVNEKQLDAKRAAFENYSKGLDHNDELSYAHDARGVYEDDYLQADWELWQAALAQREPVVEGEVVDGTPERIYLQWHGEASIEEIKETTGFVPDTEVVTWCEEQQFEHDIEYVRANVWQRTEAARLAAEVDLELARMQNEGMLRELYLELELEPDEVRFKWAMNAIIELKRQLAAERARSEKLVEALKLYMQVGDQCSRGYLAECRKAANKALAVSAENPTP